LNSKIKNEFLTTILKGFHDEAEIKKIAKFCQGAKKFTIQNFRKQQMLNPDFQKYSSFTPKELEFFKKIIEKYVETVIVM